MNREKGQVALETLLVLFLIFFVIFLLLSSFFFLSGRIVAQGVLVKATKEIAAIGCVPTLTTSGISSGSADLGYNTWVRDNIEVFGNNSSSISWKYINVSGSNINVPSCENVVQGSSDPVPSNFTVSGRVSYRPAFPLFDIFTGGTLPMTTMDFEMVSSSLEDR